MGKKEILKTSLDILIIGVGAFIIAVGLKVFFIPLKITAGGFSGLAIVFSYLFEKLFSLKLSVGIITLLLNVPIFLFGLKNNGLRFVLYSLCATILFSVFVDLINFKINLTDSILALVYGSLIIGFGLGVIIKVGASTGGSDMLAVILTKRFKRLTTGTIIIVIDVIVVLISMFSFSVENGLYSLIAIIITGKVVDVILTGFKNLVAYYIISDKFEEISIRIMNELFSGVTSLSGRGMYTKNDRQVLVVILQKRSILALKELVKEIDENAIMFSFNVHEAVGLTKISKENS